MTTKHPQHDNLIIAANDKDALFECEEANWHNVSIKIVTAHPEWNWTHIKPTGIGKFDRVLGGGSGGSGVVQFRSGDSWIDLHLSSPTITKRLYASKEGAVWFQSEPDDDFYIPLDVTAKEVECE